MDETSIQSFFVCVVITVIVALLIIKIMTTSAGIIHFTISRKGKDVSDNDEPLQIIRIKNETKDGQKLHILEINIENLEKIMFHPDVKENPVVIISIAGPFRKGKSFLLGFFLKYLETQSKVSNNHDMLFRGLTWIFDSICFFNSPAKWKGNWLRKNDKIKGFKWRGGTERVTSGIHIWSKPFICENKDGEKITVLLMDTQGVFDHESTVKDCASLFAITNLISSVQIYNLMQQLQEDDLQHLEFFTAFGKLVEQKSNETDFNNAKFIYLIRDWASPYEYPYGKDGGDRYIKKQLEINSDQHEESKKLRKKLSKFFPNIGGFLLPHPGTTVVTNREYDGRVKDLDNGFVDNVKMFVLHILSMEMLKAKRIHNKTLTGEDIVKYIKAFVELLEKGEYPSPQTAFQATAKVERGEAVKRAFKFYKDNMDKVCNLNSGKPISIESFDTCHKESKVAARDNLSKTFKLILSEHECECKQNLDILIKEEYKKLRQILDEKIQNSTLQQEATKAATAAERANSTLYKLHTVGTGIGFGLGAVVLTFQKINNFLKRER